MQRSGSPTDTRIVRCPCDVARKDGLAFIVGVPRRPYDVTGKDVPTVEAGIVGRPYGIVDVNFTPADAGATSTDAQNPLAAAIKRSRDYSDDCRSLESMLELLFFPASTQSQQSFKLLIDYSHSILLTSHEHLQGMEAKARRREEAQREAEQWKVEAARRQALRDIEKQHKFIEKVAHATNACSKELFRQRWTTYVIKQARERL